MSVPVADVAAMRPNADLFRDRLDRLATAGCACDAQGLSTYFNGKAVALWGREPKLNHVDDRSAADIGCSPRKARSSITTSVGWRCNTGAIPGAGQQLGAINAALDSVTPGLAGSAQAMASIDLIHAR